MGDSRRFINFASIFCLILFLMLQTSCKGRTIDNMEPTGDTIEVVIMQPVNEENNNN